MRFRELIGQAQPQATFRQMVESDRLPHALLLLSAPGSGGLALAWALARYLLCAQPQNGDACGQCTHCHKAAKLIHPDLHFSYPTVGSKVTADNLLPQWRTALLENPYLEINDWLQQIGAANKQGNINKDECQRIMRVLSLKSFESPRKIMIIWLPEYLGNEGNRLLKLIEEPPEGTTFILVAEEQERILNTILSRCQLVRVHPLHDDEVAAGLASRTPLSPEAALAVAQLASGNFNEALQLANQAEDDQAALFLDWMRRCYKGLPSELVDWASDFSSQGRENQKHFLRYALHFWREFTVLKTLGEDRVRLREREKQTAIGMAKIMDLEQGTALVEVLNECSLHVERNAHPKVLFLDVSIQIHHIIKRWSSYQQQERQRLFA
jgi:DNA polymerase-3 subunit delta'